MATSKRQAFYGMLADYHMHTPLCRHAKGRPSEYARHAQTLGLKEIGFAEHCPMPPHFDRLRMTHDDLPRYIESVEKARAACPGLTIRLGVEADYVEEEEISLARFFRRHAWDYVLGSVHYIGKWNFDSPSAVKRWKETKDLRVEWARYFELWKKAARCGLFDSLGHPDLVKKFGFVPRENCDDLFEDALAVVAKAGLAIEINTAGLRKPVGEIYPSAAFLRIARRLKIPITFGSDAHVPGEVGANFREAVALARSCGYTHYARLHRRKRTLHRLPENY
jgi:histidinol-phosphatase (PHP family)